jgi:RNA polymerase sigma-70 factor (ECF subfamily)
MTLTLSKPCPLAALRVADDPDTALMLRVARDEPDAFGELAAAVAPRIFARFFRTFQDRQQAEDLTQDVLLRVYRARQRYQPRARFGTWLYHIAQNVTRNALRRRRRHIGLRLTPRRADHFHEGSNDQTLLDRDCPSRPLERHEVAVAVRAAVAELATRQRQALEMLQFQNRSYAEIAAALALTTKATKSLLYRARLQLKGHLRRYADGF